MFETHTHAHHRNTDSVCVCVCVYENQNNDKICCCYRWIYFFAVLHMALGFSDLYISNPGAQVFSLHSGNLNLNGEILDFTLIRSLSPYFLFF